MVTKNVIWEHSRDLSFATFNTAAAWNVIGIGNDVLRKSRVDRKWPVQATREQHALVVYPLPCRQPENIKYSIDLRYFWANIQEKPVQTKIVNMSFISEWPLMHPQTAALNSYVTNAKRIQSIVHKSALWLCETVTN